MVIQPAFRLVFVAENLGECLPTPGTTWYLSIMNDYLTRIVRPLVMIGVFAAIVASTPLLAGAALASDETAITTRTTLTIGRVSGNPRKHAGRLMAFGEYLLGRLDE